MYPHIPRNILIDSLVNLGTKLVPEEIPKNIVQEAVSKNPWFTPYYIYKSISSIKTWMDRSILESFLDKYPNPTRPPKEIGIIAAGNLPLVGFHDVMMVILSGNIAKIKCSHQDQVLMKWIFSKWCECLSDLHSLLSVVNFFTSPAFFIATGSNNSARYFRFIYPNTPRLIRQNRFSVAILTSETTDAELTRLCDDIYAYNGLGCRNVSNLIITRQAELERWVEKGKQYSKNKLNPLYLERVLYEKARVKTLRQPILEGPNVLIRVEAQPTYTSMGVINAITVQHQQELKGILKAFQEQFQCIVGLDTYFGQTQEPGIGDFADNRDTLRLLLDV